MSYIYIYIYIYIYSHPLIDCFIVSQLFSVVRHVGCLKLGSKPAQLYIRLSIIPLSQQANLISSGIIRHYVVAFICLHFCLIYIYMCVFYLMIVFFKCMKSLVVKLIEGGEIAIYFRFYSVLLANILALS